MLIINWSNSLRNSNVDTAYFLSLVYQFFLTEQLGSTRAIVERISDTTALVHVNHYGVWAEVLEVIGVTGVWYRELYQGNELIKFKGYETYDFNLRQYDPFIGRFNSIDPVDFENQGGYNAMFNNPLSFTDPNGDCPNCIAGGIGAIIGGVANLGIKLWRGQVHSFKDGAAAFGIGAVAGFVTGFTGGAAAGAFGLSAASITGGAVAGAAGSATGGMIQGIGNALYFGDSYSGKDWAAGIGIGALTGGIGGGITARIKSGPNTNLWWGTPKSPGKSIWSFNNSATGAKGSISFGDLEFSGVDDYILNAKGVALRGENPIVGQSNTFAGQTAKINIVGQVQGRISLYPNVLDLRTGSRIPLPVTGKPVPVNQKVEWNNMTRRDFIKEWYDRGYNTPKGGWGEYDIHHILPREFGGTNDFWNLTPVLRKVHQQEFNRFWESFR